MTDTTILLIAAIAAPFLAFFGCLWMRDLGVRHAERKWERDRGAWAPPGGFGGWLIILLVVLAILWLIGIRVNVG